MARNPIAARYAQALFEVAKAEQQTEQVLEHLTIFGALLRDHPGLRTLISNPGVSTVEKLEVLDRLVKGSWPTLVRSFVHMVIALGRVDHAQEIVEAFRAAWDQDQGRLRVVVRSARRLPESVLATLRTRLARREQKTIELETEIRPELLGGLQISLDHRVIDGSVRRQIDELREQLSTARVY